jgi:glutamate racemase
MRNYPIGVIDSGVGGLSIWSELVKLLPRESTIYIGDSKNCPYGTKTDEEIYNLASKMVKFLVGQHAKIIVIACNTISVVALDRLRAAFSDVEFVGTVPAIKTASSLTKNQKIGVLATQSTAQSRYLSQLITEFANHHRVIVVGSQKLVPYVEQGIVEGEGLQKILLEELALFQKEDIDTLVLGCSHFPFLRNAIEKTFDFKNIIDSGEAIASQVSNVLESHNLGASPSMPAEHTFYTTSDPEAFEETTTALLDPIFWSTIQKVERLTL